MDYCCFEREKIPVNKSHISPTEYIKNINFCNKCNTNFSQESCNYRVAKIWKSYFLFCNDKCYSLWLNQYNKSKNIVHVSN